MRHRIHPEGDQDGPRVLAYQIAQGDGEGLRCPLVLHGRAEVHPQDEATRSERHPHVLGGDREESLQLPGKDRRSLVGGLHMVGVSSAGIGQGGEEIFVEVFPVT
jgi:hypothetical protein